MNPPGQRLKRRFRKLVPDRVAVPVRVVRAGLSTRSARRAFEYAGREPAWLDARMLETLQQSYRSRTGDYGYDPATVARRADQRARELLRLLPESHARSSILELGCRDGTVSLRLQQAGATTTALDLSGRRFDEGARRAGVHLVEGDAERLEWEDGCFDVVFSYNSFEHFPHPDAVLREAMRVTRPGGFVYLRFGPLYMSPFGLHAYHAINVPYCHLLFERDAIARYIVEKGLPAVQFENVNGWPLAGYRRLWRKHERDLEPVLYREIPYVAGLGLIRRYPSCFRAKTDEFEELTTSHIQALFRRG